MFCSFVSRQKALPINSWVVVIFYFQYGLSLPFGFFMNSQAAVVFCTFVVMAYGFICAQFRFYYRIILLALFPAFFLLLKYPYEYNVIDNEILLEFLISFLTMGVSGILIGTLPFSIVHIKNSLWNVSLINFLLISYIPFTGLYGEEVNYMRFGYAMLPTVLVAFYFLIDGEMVKKRYSGMLFIFSISELIIFGARGALFVVLLFCFFTYFLLSKFSLIQKIFTLFFIFILIMMSSIFLQGIVDFYLGAGLDSYLINKLVYLVDGKTLAESSSGRDIIWQMAIDRFLGDNILVGSPMNSSMLDTGSTYYHNILLDIAVNFGLIGFVFLFLFIAYLVYSGLSANDRDYKIVFLLFLLVPMGRLLVSSSFWQRPDFWFFISLALVNSRRRSIRPF